MPPPSDLDRSLDETLAYLGSPEAIESIAADPYWPKWDSSWWRMTLLWEMGQASLIPRAVVEAMVRALRSHYLPIFPVREEEMPADRDPYRHIICHCAVGTMTQVLDACGVAVDTELPWMRPWLLLYQLPDGGWNCDEGAYARPGGKSSIVSTLPPLEAILRSTRRPFTEEEIRALDAGAAYLLAHRLVRRASGDGGIIDPSWLCPAFPRFYLYDVLRGLSFLAEWAEVRGRTLPAGAIAEGLSALDPETDGITLRRREIKPGTWTVYRADGGGWSTGRKSQTFPLLDLVSAPGRISPELTASIRIVHERIARLRAPGLVMG